MRASRKPIDRLAAAERDRFLAGYRLAQPAVLTGGLAGWPRTLFDLRQLAGRFGAEPVLSYKLPPGAPAGRMSSVKSNFYMWSDKEGDREHLRQWTFGDFLGALGAGEPHYCMANGTKNTRLRDRLAAEAGVFGCIPGDGAQTSPAGREFFFGSESAGPGLHHDGPIESFLCQLIGPKRVNAFSPADIPNLYPADSWRAPTGHFSAVADSFNADHDRFPLFRHATAHHCELNPGDVLYMPPHWYHDTAPRGPTLTMTIRNTPPVDFWGSSSDRDAVHAAARALRDLTERVK